MRGATQGGHAASASKPACCAAPSSRSSTIGAGTSCAGQPQHPLQVCGHDLAQRRERCQRDHPLDARRAPTGMQRPSPAESTASSRMLEATRTAGACGDSDVHGASIGSRISSAYCSRGHAPNCADLSKPRPVCVAADRGKALREDRPPLFGVGILRELGHTHQACAMRLRLRAAAATLWCASISCTA